MLEASEILALCRNGKATLIKEAKSDTASNLIPEQEQGVLLPSDRLDGGHLLYGFGRGSTIARNSI